jgi:hypothetical protein
MSRTGAMIDYVLAKVRDAEVFGRTVTTSRLEVAIEEIPGAKLPYCMAWGVARETTLDEYRQRTEVTAISIAYVRDFGKDEVPLTEMLNSHELIEKEIWDGNVDDTDAAGFFAYVSLMSVEKAEGEGSRHVLVMEVIFETTDVEDSAFALEEDPT